MCAASLVRDWRPDPPTPTSSAWLRGCLMTREMRHTCSMANLQKHVSTCQIQPVLYPLVSSPFSRISKFTCIVVTDNTNCLWAHVPTTKPVAIWPHAICGNSLPSRGSLSSFLRQISHLNTRKRKLPAQRSEANQEGRSLRVRVAWPEHNEVHGLLGQVVVLLEVALDDEAQLLHIPHLDVVRAVRLRVREVTVHEAAHIVFRHLQIPRELQMILTTRFTVTSA